MKPETGLREFRPVGPARKLAQPMSASRRAALAHLLVILSFNPALGFGVSFLAAFRLVTRAKYFKN